MKYIYIAKQAYLTKIRIENQNKLCCKSKCFFMPTQTRIHFFNTHNLALLNFGVTSFAKLCVSYLDPNQLQLNTGSDFIATRSNNEQILT